MKDEIVREFHAAYDRANDPDEGINPEGLGLAGWEMWAVEYALEVALSTAVAAAEARGRKQAAHDIAELIEAEGKKDGSGEVCWSFAARIVARIARAYAAGQDTG